MSNCVYTLFGRHFGSELELDNFLYNNKDFINLDNVSDIVFSLMSVKQRASIEKLKAIHKTGANINQLKERKRNGEFLTPDETALANNHYGVNYALGRIINIENPGHALTTHFDEKNLEKEFYEEWMNEGLPKKIIDILRRTDPSIPYNEGDKIPTIEKCQEIYREYIRPYWMALGKSGNVIHKIAELVFSEDEDGNPLYDLAHITASVHNQYGNIASDAVIRNLYQNLLQFKANLIEKHQVEVQGEKVRPRFFPEFEITAKSNVPIDGNEQASLMGIIDLLIVDGNGIPHIYDYKTSDKDFNLWASAKEDAFVSQTGAYREMLVANGFDRRETAQSKIGIIPMILDLTTSVPPGGNVVVDGLVPFIDKIVQFNPDISNVVYYTNKPKLQDSSDFIKTLKMVFATENYARTHSSEVNVDFIRDFEYFLQAMFPNYNFQETLNESVIKDLMKYAARKDKNNGKWYLETFDKNEERVYFDSKEDISEEAIRKYHSKYIGRNRNLIEGYYYQIKDAVEQGNSELLPESTLAFNGQNDKNWFLKNFKRYCNGTWEFIECAPLKELGIIALKNSMNGYIEFIDLTTISLTTEVKLHKNNSSVLGSFEDDITPQYNDIDPLFSDVGNIELMKTCLAINLIGEKFFGKGFKVGNIRVMNPHLQQGRMPTSKQLLDNFNELCNLLNEHEDDNHKLVNNFSNYNIQILGAAQKAKAVVREFCSLSQERKYNKIGSRFERTGSDIKVTLNDLNAVRLELEQADNNLARGIIDTSTPEGMMYYSVMQAIAEINGAFYTQELRQGNVISLKVNNPEVMESPNMRRIHVVVNNANMKFRDQLNSYTSEWRKRLKQFKQEMGFDIIEGTKKYLLDSDYNLYKNMFDYDKETNTFQFRDPWDTTNDLKEPERKLLKWYLEAQYDLRFKGTPEYSDEHRAALRADRNSQYYEVPLLKAESQEKLVNGKTKGMVSWFKKQMEFFKHPMQRSRELIHNAHDKEDLKYQKTSAENYKMIDRFEYSENGNRRRLIESNDEYYFSHSLERIFYNYAAVKLRKQVMDEYIPIMKAILISLRSQQLLDGLKLTSLENYLVDYLKAKVLDQSLVPEDYQVLQEIVQSMKGVTTLGALGFNVKTGLFQVFEGVFKNFSRSFFKPMGDRQFGIKEYIQGMKEVFGDTPNHFKTVSMGQLLNEQYAINDQDVNQLADRLREGQDSLTFMGKAMWLTSAPDFFNRMSIFIAQMIKDDCYDAHILDSDNMRIHYDFKKDGRFKIFNDPNANKSSLEYRTQKALYERMIQQFNEEGYTTIDKITGEERRLQIGDDLPQAYTNKEARSIKSFADQLYGYYNHEDKMLLNSYLLGSLFTQFRTYWSSLKNRWCLKGGVYSQGHWEQIKTRDGELVYKKIIIDSDGNPQVELVWGENADPNTMEPAIDWKGNYQEGFLRTLYSAIKSMTDFEDDRGFKERMQDWIKGNGDESIANTRKSNLWLILHDLGVWLLISLLASAWIKAIKEKKKQDKYRNLTILDKIERDCEQTLAYSVSSSVQDLGAFKDLIDPITDWTPPSFKLTKNVFTDTMEWLSGDKKFNKVLSENIGLVRQTENLLFF